ncbi:MAG: quinolinate synthase NadA [Candidatus Omnitrophica bacterium]|nr:quinolinate synthase NadA [Candidatus Omnitrophota bacterium]
MDILQDKVVKLKKKKKAVILAHNYQISAVQDIADFIGDSLELSKISRDLKEKLIVFCGVRFMAETAKILSPQKKVILPILDAGCPLADMITTADLIALKTRYPEAWVVSYVNSSAEIKALSDVCCTSANAITVVKNVPTKQVIFVPDKNLGWWVAKNVSGKEIILWPGHCLVHEYFTKEDVTKSKELHPEAEIMVHPECRREVIEAVDQVLSTAGMSKAVKNSDKKEFIIGTEEGLVYRLKKENPNKTFYSLGSPKVCMNMKKTTLDDVYRSLDNLKYDIELDPAIMSKARLALERMVSYV